MRQQWRVLVDAISGYAKGDMERKHVKWNDTTKMRGLEIVGQFEQFIREGGAPSPELLAGVDELKDIIDAKARAEGINRSKTTADCRAQPWQRLDVPRPS